MAAALTLSFPQSDIALITFDLPGKGANILSLSVLQELAALSISFSRGRIWQAW